MTDDPEHGAARAAEPDPASTRRPERAFPTLLEQMGGVPGIVASTIPVAVFVVVNVVSELQPALIAAVASGVAVAAWRLVRREAAAARDLRAAGCRAVRVHRLPHRRGQGLLPARAHLQRGAGRRVPGLRARALAARRGDLARHQRRGPGLAPQPEAAAGLHLREPALDARLRRPDRGAGPALQRRRGGLAGRRPAGHGLSAGRRRAAGHGVGGPPRPAGTPLPV